MSGQKVFPLTRQQALAAAPHDSVWLSASAGTGKTQVLSARVLRLLLEEGVRPEQILCLTFTKAGAAEMATRVNDVLASWVRLEPVALGEQLEYIGAANTPEVRGRARSLFAAVLDCPGGGLRIDTIHAFSQWLLAAFPVEAGLTPGTRPMEDRDREMLAAQVLAACVEEWQARDAPALAALEELSRRLGPDAARAWLMTCARAGELWLGQAGWQPPLRDRVERLLGLPEGAGEAWLAELCCAPVFDETALRACLAGYRAWKSQTGQIASEVIPLWLEGDGAARLALLPQLADALLFKNGKGKLPKEPDPAMATASEQVAAGIARVAEARTLIDLAAFLAPALELGRRFFLAWEEAKAREGLVDFDDLIRRAAALLGQAEMADWIRYKLDRRFDHILIDEAQDTNPAQWEIIGALTGDFFTGLGAAGEKLRTIFVVGDYKQAIFGFQGTSPENFATARARYARQLQARADAAELARETLAGPVRPLQELGLDRSYRTAQDVLGFVDAAIAAIGADAFGLDRAAEPHEGDPARPGLVTLWQPVSTTLEEGEVDAEDDGDDGEDGPELGVSSPERVMADKIASQIQHWLQSGYPLVKGQARNAQAGDIMVLVRQRGGLAGLIVARLHARGVPVAGVDRLRLGAPLAVQDLLAALRFAVQPGDDLTLAALLVSPLLGWSQEELLEHGWRPDKVALWDHLRDLPHPRVVQTVAQLRELLARADFAPPQVLLHWLLVGPWQGRAKLLARLGREAGDPIDELINAALQFAASNTPSLQGFLHWFDAGDGELKREAEGPGGLVRVMTVHGSKGLQAPIVILADACGDPDKARMRGLELTAELPGSAPRRVPVPPLAKAGRVGPLAAAEKAARAAERAEHWRLLYVALTRAEEALFIGGALGTKQKQAPADSWYARLAPLFPEAVADPDWVTRAEIGQRPPDLPPGRQGEFDMLVQLPDWARRPIGEEPRPPRPLAPSAMAQDNAADPPLPVAAAALAARRGVLIHALLERLPDVPVDLRPAAARAWLARQAGDMAEAEREEMQGRALAVLAQPGFAELFGPQALAEVPFSATVGTAVIAGTIDRLLVTPERILVADFKTARRPPANLEQVPPATLAQMAAYVAALEVIWPGRVVEAAVLYTQVPRLIALPGELLAAMKPGLTGDE